MLVRYKARVTFGWSKAAAIPVTDLPLPVGIANAVNREVPRTTLSMAVTWSGYHWANLRGNPNSTGFGSAAERSVFVLNQILKQ